MNIYYNFQKKKKKTHHCTILSSFRCARTLTSNANLDSSSPRSSPLSLSAIPLLVSNFFGEEDEDVIRCFFGWGCGSELLRAE